MRNENKAVLTVDEAAEFLRIGRSCAYQAVATGEIPSIRIGKRILVPKQALERLLTDCNREPNAEV